MKRIQKFIWQRKQWPLLTVIIASIVYGVIFSIIALNRYWQYEAWYYDFGIFARAIYLVSRFQPPIIDHFVIPDHLIFGDHFHPFIFILSPLFWFTSKPEILLVAQAALAGLSGIVMYLTAQKLTKNTFLSLCLLVIYFSFIGLHYALITEFHEIALLPLPLSLFFYSLVTKNIRLYVIATIMVLLVKESTFFITTVFCFFEIFKSKGTWRKLNIWLSIASFIYGVLVFKVVIPYFSGGIYQYGEEAEFAISKIYNLYDTPLKIKTIWQTLASYGFLPLAAPEMLIPVVMNWYTRFSISSVSRHGLGLHYNAEIAPTLLFATMTGIQRLRKLVKKGLWIIAGMTVITLWCVYFSVFTLDSPVRLAVLPDFYRHSKEFQFLDDLVAHVPQDGLIMAEENIAPRLITRRVKILRDNYEHYSPDWIVVDTRADQNPNNFFGLAEQKPDIVFPKLAKDSNYEVYYQHGPQIIYKKKN